MNFTDLTDTNFSFNCQKISNNQYWDYEFLANTSWDKYCRHLSKTEIECLTTNCKRILQALTFQGEK